MSNFRVSLDKTAKVLNSLVGKNFIYIIALKPANEALCKFMFFASKL